jgi:hypothetical protein
VPFYEIERAYQMQNFQKKQVPFNSDSKRLDEPTSLINPGPGYYTINQQSDFMVRRSIESFGSTAKRSIDQPKSNDRLGPGCYESTFKKATIVQKSSVFASKQARPFQLDPKRTHSFNSADKKFAAY